jgi:AraC-like DNA-binding protein
VALNAHAGLAAPDFAALVPVGGAHLRGWKQQLQLVASSPELLASARSSPRVAAHLEGLLIDLFATGHVGNEIESGFASKRSLVSPGFVKRAEAFIEANCREPLALPDLANAVGVSARTLRDGFQQFRGVSPMQYVRQLRLERARDALRAAPLEVRVAEITLDCGFAHPGRFAMVCKAMFGESPSETLRAR